MTDVILSILGLVGIGGIFSVWFTKQKELQFKALENKERRYKSCLLYMDVYFEPQNIKYLSSRQPDIHGSADVIEYLKAEYHEMVLFASKDVILTVKQFIEAPSRDLFLQAILEMRKDLWSKKAGLTLNEIKLQDDSI